MNEYPKAVKKWGAKSNSERACKNFLIESGQFGLVLSFLINHFNIS